MYLNSRSFNTDLKYVTVNGSNLVTSMDGHEERAEGLVHRKVGGDLEFGGHPITVTESGRGFPIVQVRENSIEYTGMERNFHVQHLY